MNEIEIINVIETFCAWKINITFRINCPFFWTDWAILGIMHAEYVIKLNKHVILLFKK